MKQLSAINPKSAGGEGLSHATGTAGFPNGATFLPCNITRPPIALSPDDRFALHPASNRYNKPISIIGLRTSVAF